VTAASIVACRDARAAHWQLGPLPPPSGRFTLLTWTADDEVDGGVPARVAHALARSWTGIARLTCLSSRSTTKVIATSDASVAVQLFDDPEFPWWLQGQAVLLSREDGEAPDIDQRTIVMLLHDDWAERAATLATRGIEAVVRPGVDGDVAGILSLSDSFDEQLLVSLEREARQDGITFSMVSEAALLEPLPRGAQDPRGR